MEQFRSRAFAEQEHPPAAFKGLLDSGAPMLNYARDLFLRQDTYRMQLSNLNFVSEEGRQEALQVQGRIKELDLVLQTLIELGEDQ